MCSLIDSRKSERVKCKMDILHNTPPADFFYNGQLRNYSKKGLYFESNEYLLPQNEISILVKKSASGKIRVLDVKIIWCKELQDSSFDFGYPQWFFRSTDYTSKSQISCASQKFGYCKRITTFDPPKNL